MSEKLGQYEELSSNARLRQLLGAQGGVNGSGDFVAARLAELRGQKQPITPK